MRLPVTERVVMFSGGVGSWLAARRTVEAHGTDGVALLFADTNAEEPDVYRFLHEAAEDIGAPLVIVADGRTPHQVFRDRRFLGNARQANCSEELKQKPAATWLAADAPDATVVVGIDWSESHRLPAIRRAYAAQGHDVEAPLCERPWVDKAGMIAAARARGLTPPSAYAEGFPHANCASMCVRGGHEQWRRLLYTHPERYQQAVEMEADLTAHLGRVVAILRHRSGPQKGQPLPLAEYRQRLTVDPSLLDEEQGEWGGCGCLPSEAA